MCFYDQTVYSCGDAKWGNFRAHCTKEYRTGETCGMKLVNQTFHLYEACKICEKIEIKQRRIEKEESNIRRWKKDGGNWRANIAQSKELIANWHEEIRRFNQARAEKQRDLR